MIDDDEVKFRPMRASDFQFVVSGWSSSFRLSHTAGMITMDDWATVMHRQIAKVLDRLSTTTIVAHSAGDEDHLRGFIAARLAPAPYVYYLFVKEPYRRAGHARELFAAAGIDPEMPFAYACKTAWTARLRDKIPAAQYDPLNVRFPEPKEAP